jgi:hypothetical protein
MTRRDAQTCKESALLPAGPPLVLKGVHVYALPRLAPFLSRHAERLERVEVFVDEDRVSAEGLTVSLAALEAALFTPAALARLRPGFHLHLNINLQKGSKFFRRAKRSSLYRAQKFVARHGPGGRVHLSDRLSRRLLCSSAAHPFAPVLVSLEK